MMSRTVRDKWGEQAIQLAKQIGVVLRKDVLQFLAEAVEPSPPETPLLSF